MRSERRRREGESKIFKLTCIPTLLAAPPPKQYSTPTLIPPATQAMGIATQKYIKKMKLDLFWLDCTSDLRSFWTQLPQDCTEGEEGGGRWLFGELSQNSAELALVQAEGSRVPAANPYPKIPKVPPRGSRHIYFMEDNLLHAMSKLQHVYVHVVNKVLPIF